MIAAATAAAGDNNALTAAISAGGAEAAAPYVSQWLYGEQDGSKLTAEQKQTVSSILSLGGAAVGAANGSAVDTVAGGQAARTAVENNFEAIFTPKGRDYLSNVSSLAQSSLAYHQGNIASMMKDINDYSSCKGCKDDGHRYVEFILDSSSQVAMTVATGGAVHVIRGAKAAHYLDTLRKVTQNEKAVTFTINGVANASMSAVFDESQRSADSFIYNVVVGGTAGTVAARIPTVKKNMAAQGTVYGVGELAKHALYGNGEAAPKTSDVIKETGKVFIGGAVGAGTGNIISKSIPPSNANTAIDALSGSLSSSFYGYAIKKITGKKEEDKK